MRALHAILDFLFPPTPEEALVRMATLESLGNGLRAVSIGQDSVALLPYKDPLVKACVTQAKFSGSRRAMELLGTVLSEYLAGESEDRAPFGRETVVLIPLPLGPKRRTERGYNQAEEIARYAARSLAETEVDAGLLMRSRETLPQTSLDGAGRRENVRGAFATARAPDPAHTYIVVDDVATTGATLHEAVAALRAAGAMNVTGLSLAH